MIKGWMFEHLKVLVHLTRVVNCNKESDEMESMFIAGKKRKNIISYVDCSRICHVIKCFPDLKQTFGKEYFTFNPSSSSRSMERRKKII